MHTMCPLFHCWIFCYAVMSESHAVILEMPTHWRRRWHKDNANGNETQGLRDWKFPQLCSLHLYEVRIPTGHWYAWSLPTNCFHLLHLIRLFNHFQWTGSNQITIITAFTNWLYQYLCRSKSFPTSRSRILIRSNIKTLLDSMSIKSRTIKSNS